jgi:redox-sensitive bicupin YhaK (pirin superfamily)
MRIALSGLRAVIAHSPGPSVDHGRRVDEVWFMSNLERSPRETACGGRAGVAVEPVRELMDGRPVALGGPRAMSVTRTLPNRTRRMVGAWCFVDYYGPNDISRSAGMQVAPHPHTGLQTVSWLVAGEVLHRDSVGSRQLVTPGQLNLMTAGHGISHSEESLADHSPILHGVQLWTALPDPDRHVRPHFEHHPDLPVLTDTGVTVKVIMGELGGTSSPAAVYSPLVGAEAVLEPGADTRLPLQPSWEYGVLTLAGSVDVDGAALAPGPLLYLGSGRSDLPLRAEHGARLMLIGGEPFEEHIVMWWNFVGRDHDDIATAREQWMRADPRFGTVHGYPGDRLPAPMLPTVRLKPRGRQA